MNRKKEIELKKAGYKPVPKSVYWLNSTGKVYNQRTGKTVNPRIIKTDDGGFSIEKAVLWLFAGIPPRGGQIVYLDGNKANIAVENLKYTSVVTLPPETVNRENLCRAIRCFYEIDRKAKPRPSNILIRFKLARIYKAVNFAEKHRNKPYFSVFEQWINEYENDVFEPTETAPPEKITVRERQAVKAHYLNLLTAEICAGLDAGIYELKPFALTKAEKRKIYVAKLKKLGVTIPRRKSNKQRLKEWQEIRKKLITP